MKKLITITLSLLILSTLMVGCSPRNRDIASFAFATSGQGGTFYTAGSGISSLVGSRIENLEVTAEVTRGVVENVRLMASGQSEMGFSYGSTAYMMQRGLAEFKGHQYDGLRAVANIHDGAMNFVALERSDIKTLDDLVNKKVSIGTVGSGSAAVAEEFLRAVDLYDEIQIQNLSFDDSASALRDGHIDAFIVGGTTPVPSIIELEASHKLTFIPIEGEIRDQFLEDHPYHVPYTIPADGYTSLDEPVETIGYTVIWVANEDVPEWVIYEMLNVMLSNEGMEYLINVQKAFQEMSPGLDRFNNIQLPLHPGAEKYYKEKGLI